MKLRNWFIKLQLAFAASLVGTSQVEAHFPWLALDGDHRVVYFFGETLAQRDYKLPENIATSVVHAIATDGTSQTIAMEPIETDGFIGRKSKSSVELVERIESNVTYGIHGGSRLDYYTSTIPGKLPKSSDLARSKVSPARLQSWAVDTEGGVTIEVHWDSQPLENTEVKLFNEKGDESAAQKTNTKGQVDFTDSQVQDGLNAILVGFTQNDQAGQLGDRKYQSTSHYLTMSFRDPEGPAISKKPESTVSRATIPSVPTTPSQPQTSLSTQARTHSDLPMPLTSFGAVRLGNTIFVYGGHTGEAHHYSTEEQSDALLALDLTSRDARWQELTKGRRLQGLGLVAYGDSVIRIGGFEAVNGLNEEHDLRSSTEVMAFDLKNKAWTKLPDLPEPRSSHDAIIAGDRLYVIGGWTLKGTETQWLSTAWSIPLPAEGKTWESLPSPPFSRRAIALAASQDRIYAIGGMNEKGGPTTEVACYQIESQEWRTAPALRGKPMNGFGAAAWNHEDTIIVTTSEGDIQKLSPNAESWELAGKVVSPRFFHRLLPYSEGKLVALGGVNMKEQIKLPNLEIVPVP